MLNRKAQSLPTVSWPQLTLRDYQIAMMVLLTIVVLETIALAIMIAAVVLPRLAAAPPAAPAIAQLMQSAPVAQPAVAEPVVAPVVEVAPAQVEPVIAPKIPLMQIEWKLVPGAPEAQALFVRDGILYAVESLPSGAITWSRNGIEWAYRKATSEEIQLMATRGWLDVGDFVAQLLGGTRWGGAVAVTEQTVTFFQYPGRDSDVYASRLFLRDGEAWVELNPPQNMGMFYSFVKVGDELIVAGWDENGTTRLWRAQQNP